MRILNYDIALKRSVTPKEPWGGASDDRWYTSIWSVLQNGTKEVNHHTAQGSSAVFAGVKIITETLSSVPCVLYKRKEEDKRVRAVDHPLYDVLKNLANPMLTAGEFREIMTKQMILQGNGFAQIVRNGAGQVVELYPLEPARMRLLHDPELGYSYEYINSKGDKSIMLPVDVFHLRGPSDDGLWGKSFVSMLKDLIDQNLTLEEYSHNFYKNNANPSGVLEMAPGIEMSPKAKETLRADWKKKYGGSGTGTVAILEEGLTWKQVGMSSQDAQFIDTLKDAREQILGAMRVPLYMAGNPEKLSFNTIEQLAIQFITFTMLPHFMRWEQTVSRCLLTASERKKYFAEFLVDGLQRGDILSRYRAYSIGRQWGWLSADDIRRLENLEPLAEGGDIYLQPLNMIDAAEATEYLLSSKESGDDEKEPGVKMDGDDNSNPTLKNNSNVSDMVQRIMTTSVDRRNGEILRELRLQRESIELRVRATEDLVKELISDLKEGKKSEFQPKTSKKAPDFDEPSFGDIRAAGIEMFSETLARFLRKEMSARDTAEKKGKLDTFEQDFFPKQKEQIVETIRSQVKLYLEQVRLFARGTDRDVLQGSLVPEKIKEISSDFTELYVREFKGAVDPERVSEELASKLAGMIEQVAARDKAAQPVDEPEVVEPEQPQVKFRQKITIEKDESGNKIYYLDKEEVLEKVATNG